MTRLKMKLWLCSLVILWAAKSSAAQTSAISPPALPDLDHLISTLASAPISKVAFGNLSVELEKTTLDQVRLVAGGTIQHDGDSGGSKYWLCYTTSQNKQPVRIWILSGELGGEEHLIVGFHAKKMKAKASANCPLLPLQLRQVISDSAVWLGSTTKQLTNLLGEPSETKDDWWLYSYSGKLPANGFDRLTILGARIKGEKVIDFFASQATTN